MLSIDQVLEKLKDGESVQLCDIYSSASLEGKIGEEKRLVALSAWLSNGVSQAPIAKMLNLLSGVIIQGGVNVDPYGRLSDALTLQSGQNSSNVALPENVYKVSLAAVGSDIYFNLGSNSLTSASNSSHYIKAGERIEIDAKGYTYIAAIRAGSTDGTLRISPFVFVNQQATPQSSLLYNGSPITYNGENLTYN